MSPTLAPPHPALQPYVRRYIEVVMDLPPGEEVHVKTIPAGGVVLAVRWGGDFQIEAGPARGGVPAAALAGQTLRAETVCLRGTLRAFMVAFRPAGASDLLRLPAAGLRERSENLGAVLGRAGEDLADRLATAPSFAARCAAADAFLLERLGRAQLSLGARAAALVEAASGLRVDDLALRLGVPGRTLRRHFAEEVGMPAKAFAQLVRFRAAHAFLAHTPGATWADAVLRFGYVDQSHLGRAYRRFAGEPPTRRGPAPSVLDRVEGVGGLDGPA